MNDSFEHNDHNPVVSSSDDIEAKLPDFQFLGCNGNYYTIGHTPHSFMERVNEFFSTTLSQEYILDSKEFDLWLWMHLIGVDGQRDIKLEDVKGLYFEIDVPKILEDILGRLHQAQRAKAQMLDSVKKSQQVINNSIDDLLKVNAEQAAQQSVE